MNRTTTRRAGDKTDICLMAGCSVLKTAFLILIIFMIFIKNITFMPQFYLWAMIRAEKAMFRPLGDV